MERVVDEGQCLRFQSITDEQEGLPVFGGQHEGGDEVLRVGDLFVGHQDVGVLQFTDGLVLVGAHVGGDETALKDDALLDVEGGHILAGLVDLDDPFHADFVEGFSDHRAQFPVFTGDGRDARHLFLRGDLDRVVVERFHRTVRCFQDALLQLDRVGAGGHILEAFFQDSLREDGGSGGAVAGGVVRFDGDGLHEFDAHIFNGVFKDEGAGDGDAVVGHKDFGVSHGGVRIVRTP